MNEPFVIFKLALNIAVEYKIRINDIEIDTSNDESTAYLEIPINHFLIKGSNALLARLKPYNNSHPDSISKISILKSTDLEYSKNEVIFEKSVVTRDIDAEKGLLITELFSARLDNGYSSWFSCEKIELNSPIIAKCQKQLTAFHYALSQKDIEAVFVLSKLRMDNFIRCYQRNRSEYLKNIKATYISELNNPDFVLWPLGKQQIIPKLFGLGKLLKFENEQGNSPLLLFNEKEMLSSYFDIYFGTLDNKEVNIVL